MSERQKTAVLFGFAFVCFVVMCSVILLQSPSPFAVIVEQGDVAAVTTTAMKSSDQQTSTTTKPSSVTIDINTAGEEEWMLLDGMTKPIARNILIYRDRMKYFASVEELLEVDGVTESLLEKWRDHMICS